MVTGSASRHRPAGRLSALLVMAVLAGVLGMHGLGPQGAVSPSPAETAHTMRLTHSAGVPEASDACSHTDSGGHDLAHADATCAAAGTVSPYALPAPAAALDVVPASAASLVTAPGTASSGRAPPDLSELQLLRI
ncbi:DUF6153 family protein [Streptomyces sp. TRM76130]|nr:DUF6153 family protein [Streptomyces sp. TRM76130]